MGDLCKVLVVDDEILVRQGIKHFLDWEQEGFQIVGEAANGKEALELLERLQPHIVITDIVMPVMDGEELTRQIKRKQPATEIVVLSSFSEFDYVRSTFQNGASDYILKPQLQTDMLLQVLRKTAARIPSLCACKSDETPAMSAERILGKLMSGYETGVGREVAASYFPLPEFCLVGLEMIALTDGGQSKPAVHSRIEEELDCLQPAAWCYPVPAEGLPSGLSLYVLNMEQGHYGSIETLAGEWTNREDITGETAQLVISRAFDDITQMKAVFEDSLQPLLQYAFFLPRGMVLYPSALPLSSGIRTAFELNHFIERLKRLQLDEAFDELRGYALGMAGDYTTDVYEFKSFLGNIVFNVTTLLGGLHEGCRTLEEEKYTYFRAIDEAGHAEDALGCLERFIDIVYECLEESRQETSANHNMKQLLEYIEEHYAEPLSLTEMAKHFHFNPSYLSSFFTAHNKEGFKEYLNRIRISKAEKMLRESAEPISEISCLVGYGDHSYFCKVFKKHTGYSPSRYRRQFYV